MPNRFLLKLLYKLWLIKQLKIIDDIKPLLVKNVIAVEKHRTFKAPNIKDLKDNLHMDKDGYPIYINKDGIVFQHMYKTPIHVLRGRIHKFAGAVKYHNNIIYNFNYYREDCYFVIHFIKSHIEKIIKIKAIKIDSYDIFHTDVSFYDYKVICC